MQETESDSPTHVPTNAQLRWDNEGQPISTQFDDFYFSRANGLEETQYVFLDQNHLTQRWENLTNGKRTFVIGETGFGTGLNFLASWQRWNETAPREAELHFISVEKFPLRKADMQQALALWPQLSILAQQLVEAYPAVTSPGFHRLNFDQGRVRLTLIIDEAVTGLEQLLVSTHPLYTAKGPRIDTWFLDGFAPAKNPQMWRDELFHIIGQLSAEGTTLATFAATSIITRGLQAVGFTVEKAPGFGRKREMIRANIRDTLTAPDPKEFPQGPFNARFTAPWATTRLSPALNQPARRAIVIGAGLAGCHTARALAERHWQVTLIEQHGELATEGSGNPQGILYAKLSPKHEPLPQFNLAALLHAQRVYSPLWQSLDENFGQQCGVIQLAHTDKEATLHQSLQENYGEAADFVRFVQADQASALAGIELQHPGLYFPSAGWIHPPSLCQYLVGHNNITIMRETAVAAIEQDSGLWQLQNKHQQTIASAPVVVIAAANQANTFAQTQHLPLRPIRGQVSYLPATTASKHLKTVLCSEGYIAPVHDDQHCLGATFNLKDASPELRACDHQHNLDNLEAYTPSLRQCFEKLDSNNLDGRVAFRCSTRDYLPIVGPAPKYTGFLEDYALLRKNAKSSIPVAGDYWQGLYLNIGHGSRGLAYTPLCAELIAAQITRTPLPLTRDLTTALNPARFIIRDLIRNKI